MGTRERSSISSTLPSLTSLTSSTSSSSKKSSHLITEMSKKDDNDVSVTREDQGMINAFSRHNAHHVEITDKLSELKKQLENINEAKEELELQIEDDKVPLKIGEVFVHFEQDDTAPYLDQLVEKMEKQVRQLEAEASSTKEKMNGLKGRLYAKFGNSINLEADDSK